MPGRYYSSSSFHRSISQPLQMYRNGFFPSTHSTLPHAPHSMDVRIGSSSEVSTLYMTRPASGKDPGEGDQFGSAFSSDAWRPLDSATNRRGNPAIRRGVPTNRPVGSGIVKRIPVPMSVQAHPDIRMFQPADMLRIGTYASLPCFNISQMS